jgi:4-diphosphocytidyl-2-C-methyl-D-erythritol kinase
LHVTGQRADGYHLLDSLVVFTQAGDHLTVRSSESDSFDISGPYARELSGDADNLVTRARDLLRELSGTNFAVDIELEKNLPIASGIGGGSSDAAAALRALSELWNVLVPAQPLADAALSLGADLPMCLTARPLVARGIGDVIEHVTGLPRINMVLVNPGVAVPTPSVFRALESRNNPPLLALPSQPAFADLVAWLAHHTRNDLEAPALSIAPVIGEAIGALRANGAALARMSGSGATCFGLYADEDEASRAAASIAKAHPSWYVVATQTTE